MGSGDGRPDELRWRGLLARKRPEPTRCSAPHAHEHMPAADLVHDKHQPHNSLDGRLPHLLQPHWQPEHAPFPLHVVQPAEPLGSAPAEPCIRSSGSPPYATPSAQQRAGRPKHSAGAFGTGARTAAWRRAAHAAARDGARTAAGHGTSTAAWLDGGPPAGDGAHSTAGPSDTRSSARTRVSAGAQHGCAAPAPGPSAGSLAGAAGTDYADPRQCNADSLGRLHVCAAIRAALPLWLRRQCTDVAHDLVLVGDPLC